MTAQFRLQPNFKCASALAGVFPVPEAVQLTHGRAARAPHLFEVALNKTSPLNSTKDLPEQHTAGLALSLSCKPERKKGCAASSESPLSPGLHLDLIMSTSRGQCLPQQNAD